MRVLHVQVFLPGEDTATCKLLFIIYDEGEMICGE